MKFVVQNNQKVGKTKTQVPSNQTNISTSLQSYYFNIMNPSNKIQCDECKKDITKCTKILANGCDYCVGCFASLEQVPIQYHVINKLDFPVFDSDWTAEEELLLFEGLQKHGFGNWSEIADFIGPNKTRQDVQQHYTSVYLQAEEFLPTKREVLSRRDNNGKLHIKQQLNKTEKKKNQKNTTKQTSSSNHQFQRGSLTTVHNVSSTVKTGTNPADIVGYMPKRKDFQVQYDNDAQLLLAEMQFNDDDSEQQRDMKFKLIDIYNHKLDQRTKRKQFVISRGLLDLKQQSRLQKNRTKQEKQIYNMMKVFARFSQPDKHQQLVQGIIRQKQIRQRIQQLKQYKKKGLRTLAQIQQQLDNKRKKQQKNKRKHQNDHYGVGFGQKNTTRRAMGRKDLPIEKSQKKTTYLTKQQEQLCTRFNLTFKQYMLIKQTLIRESIKQGILIKDQSSKLFRIDRGVTDGVFDFLVEKQQIIGRD